MAVFLAILKWIFIVLGILLGLLVLIGGAVLFAPVRYKLKVESQGRTEVGFTFSWLCHLLTLKKKMDSDAIVLRVFGIPLVRPRRKKSSGRKKKKDRVPEKTDRQSAGTEEEKPEPQKSEEKKTPRKNKKNVREKKRFSFSGLSSIMDFVKDMGNRSAVRTVAGEAFGLIRYLKPRRIKGYLHVGTGDPATTGFLVGGMSLFPVFYEKSFRILPDFEEKVLEISLYMRGRIRILFLIRILLRLYRDKEVRGLLNVGIKKKEAA